MPNICWRYMVCLSEYRSKIVFVGFDPNVDSIEQTQPDLLKPELLGRSIETELELLCSPKQEVMLYGADLNCSGSAEVGHGGVLKARDQKTTR